MIELVTFSECHKPVNLLCFHYAGGGANYYKNWLNHLPPDMGLFAVRLPGRENLFAHVAYQNVEDIFNDLELTLAPLFSANKSLILFGHSMGGLLAFETARRFSDREKIKCLAISGFGHPMHIKKKNRHLLSDTMLRQLMNYSDLADKKYAEEIIDLMLPTIRNDYAVCDTYVYKKTQKLSVPIITFVGKQDAIHTTFAMQQWHDETTNKFLNFSYEGDHFFISRHYSDMVNKLLNSNIYEN